MPPSTPLVRWRLPFLSTLLLVSGACALVYQTAWLREFRLIFGGATPATAAVLAVFMGGLGAGGAWWGRRAEGNPNLLRLYAGLELGIGTTAALTPFLLDATRALYVRAGGALALGTFGATGAQLLLTAVVLGVPCFLLGGNLPPCIEMDRDRRRPSARRPRNPLWLQCVWRRAGRARQHLLESRTLGNPHDPLWRAWRRLRPSHWR